MAGQGFVSRFLGAMGQVLAENFSPPAAAAPTPMRESAGLTIDKDEDNWRPLTEDVRRDLSPVSQARMRRMARYLWESNPLANRLIELPLAYLLAEGVRVTCKDKGHQDLLDRFWHDPINKMKVKLPKKVRELSIYGEQCYPAFVNDVDGFVRLGYLDPELIEHRIKDPDNPEHIVGIITYKNRAGISRKYRVIINGPESVFTEKTQALRQTFTDGDAFYFAVNDLSNGSAGRSDLLAQIDWLDAYDEFLFGELDRLKFIRAFIWDVTLAGATEADVIKKAKSIGAPQPGSVRVHNDAETWSAESPDLKMADNESASRLFRNHILGGSTMPEHWYGGGGNVNRAAAAEMGEPTFKIYTMRQQTVRYMLEEICTYVLRKAALAVSASDELDLADEKNVVTAEFPEMTAQDTTAYATALQQLIAGVAIAIDAGLLTELTAVSLISAIAQRLGVKIEAEKELKSAQAELDAKKALDANVTDLPGTGEPPDPNAPVDPNAPPAAPAKPPGPKTPLAAA
jgi:hypothetical protein